MKKVALLLSLSLALTLVFSCAKKPPPGDITEEEPIIIEEEEEGIFTEEPAVEETTVVTPPPPTPTTVYSVQIGAFYDNANAEKRKAMASSFLDQSIYIEYIAPYYKVRVGNFVTKAEATSYKLKIIGYFSDAFVAETTRVP